MKRVFINPNSFSASTGMYTYVLDYTLPLSAERQSRPIWNSWNTSSSYRMYMMPSVNAKKSNTCQKNSQRDVLLTGRSSSWGTYRRNYYGFLAQFSHHSFYSHTDCTSVLLSSSVLNFFCSFGNIFSSEFSPFSISSYFLVGNYSDIVR
jgi:hypothetical protein